MSDGKRIPYADALALVYDWQVLLKPACERIAVAGSLRRHKETVGDIELVCIPNPTVDLFGEVIYHPAPIDARLYGHTLAVDGPRQKRIELPQGISLELYITTPAQWGVMYTLRTGCAEFSEALVTQRVKGGVLPSNLYVRDGRMWRAGEDEPLETPEEEDVFRAAQLPWLAPWERGETWRKIVAQNLTTLRERKLQNENP